MNSIAFLDIYEEWFGEVTRFIRCLGGPSADLEDLTQEVFVVVQRRLPDFDGQNLKGWLYQIAAHKVRDHRRKAWFKNLFLRRGDTTLEHLVHPGASAAELVEQKQLEAQLYRFVDQLSEKRRATFLLFEIEGYSGEEIAELHQVSLNTVWSRLHHARKELAERFERLDREGAR